MAESQEETTQEGNVPMLSRLRPPAGAVRRKKRVGRGPGSGKGKTSGKGMKGMKARHPGGFSKLGFEGGQIPLYRRIPKFGFKNIFSKNVETVNVKDLERFDGTVDVDALKAAGLVRKNFDLVKVLGDGELSKSLTVSAHAFSKGAREKIEKAGGSVNIIELPKPAPIKREKKNKE